MPQHLWTAGYIYPVLSDAYGQLRAELGKSEPPLNVIVSACGTIDLGLPVFQSGKISVVVMTTQEGAERIHDQTFPPWVQVNALQQTGSLSARAILNAVKRIRSSDIILVEGGPQLMGDFLAEQCLEDMFLKVALQVAGCDRTSERPGLVAGRQFAPNHPLWGTLVGVKRTGSHLFLRYSFGKAG